MQRQLTIGLVLVGLWVSMSGCGRDGAENLPKADVPAAAADDTVVSELAGTSWRLVRIQSMDDTEYVPEDSSKYTLAFQADGSAAIRADCNRGKGTYTSESPSQLQFGPIASTKALCPPDSLHDVYLRQFEWVRSYVLKDEHLYLATMADGAIIEFEPMSP